MLKIKHICNFLTAMIVTGYINTQQILNLQQNIQSMNTVKTLKKLQLVRYYTTDKFVIGHLYYGDTKWFTLELPYRENKRRDSSIPLGEYVCRYDGKKLRVYDVPDRTEIQIHVGNYTKDTHGCILVGLTTDYAGIQKSWEAFKKLTDYVKTDYFILKIQ